LNFNFAEVSEMSSRLTSESRIYADKARDLNRQVSLIQLMHENYPAKLFAMWSPCEHTWMYGWSCNLFGAQTRLWSHICVPYETFFQKKTSYVIWFFPLWYFTACNFATQLYPNSLSCFSCIYIYPPKWVGGKLCHNLNRYCEDSH
jgi:hypothetical protein